jgi:acyl carrier protein
MDPRLEIRRFIAETFFVDEFSDDDSFLQTGIIDSTGMMELVAFVQRRFGIEVGDRDLVPENFDSLANLARFLANARPHAA